jgi:hypothetical protein
MIPAANASGAAAPPHPSDVVQPSRRFVYLSHLSTYFLKRAADDYQ